MSERRNTTTVMKRGDDARFFVWLKGLRGPEPQLWMGDKLKGSGQFQRGKIGDGDLLACTPLPESDERKLFELARDSTLRPAFSIHPEFDWPRKHFP